MDNPNKIIVQPVDQIHGHLFCVSIAVDLKAEIFKIVQYSPHAKMVSFSVIIFSFVLVCKRQNRQASSIIIFRSMLTINLCIRWKLDNFRDTILFPHKKLFMYFIHRTFVSPTHGIDALWVWRLDQYMVAKS